ncbi:MAG: methionyl-tRNA formyltransferase, partial [Nitrospiraceae bacterium]
GAYTYARDDRWIIWRAAPADRPPSKAFPGTIIEARKEGILVSTGKGLLTITELQPVNSRRMSITQYLAGHTLSPGLVLGAGPSPSNGG